MALIRIILICFFFLLHLRSFLSLSFFFGYLLIPALSRNGRATIVCTKTAGRSGKRHSALVRAFSAAAYYSIGGTDGGGGGSGGDDGDGDDDGGTASLSTFVPMAERASMAAFKHAVSAGTETEAQLADAKRFLDAQVELAADYVQLLQSVLQATSSQHLAAYELTMRGVKAEPQFGVFVARAAVAAQTAQDRHGRKVLQTTADMVTLYEHATAVSDPFLHFVEQTGLKTKGSLMVQTADFKVTAVLGSMEYVEQVQFKIKKDAGVPGFLGRLKLKNKERVVEKSGMRADGANKYNVEIVCDVVRAGLAYRSIAELQATLEMILASRKRDPPFLPRICSRTLMDSIHR